MFFNARREVVQPWFDEFGRGVTVVLDPDAELYEALGTRRRSYLALAATALVGAIKALREGIVAKPTRADMKRQGADVAVDADGEMVLKHIAAHPDDRLEHAELLAALARG